MSQSSPTPAPRHPATTEIRRTMEMRISRTENELEQLRSTRSSVRSMSVSENEELHRRIALLEANLAKTHQDLQQSQATIKVQSEIIQQKNPAPNRMPFDQPNPSFPRLTTSKPPQLSTNQMSSNLPRNVSVTGPPHFDPHGTFTMAERSAQPRINNYVTPPSVRPNYQSYSLPQQARQPQITSPFQHQLRSQRSQYPPQNTPYQATYQSQSRYPQSDGQANFGHSNIQSPPAAQPGTLGFGLAAGQRSEPATSRNTYLQTPTVSHQNQLSRSSYGVNQSQPASNQVSNSSQSSAPASHLPKPAPSNPQMSTALVRISTTAQDLRFAAAFEKLFTMSERYAYAHANFPSASKDAMLSSYLKEKLQKIAGADAGNLMSNGQTRYYVIARVINQWICKHILKRTCFSGFNPKVDASIKQAAESIYQTTPLPVRAQLLTQIATEVETLKKDDNFKNFFYKICKDRGNDLWAILKPMMHQKTSKDWDDLWLLMVEAHNLAAIMLGGPYEWRLEFNDVGDIFHCSTMINKDPFLKGFSPEEMERRGAIVRMAVSALVGFRTYSQTGGMEASTVLNAFVLTKWAHS